MILHPVLTIRKSLTSVVGTSKGRLPNINFHQILASIQNFKPRVSVE